MEPRSTSTVFVRLRAMFYPSLDVLAQIATVPLCEFMSKLCFSRHEGWADKCRELVDVGWVHHCDMVPRGSSD